MAISETERDRLTGSEPRSQTKAAIMGIIESGKSYTPDVFSAMTGLGRDAIRIAEDNGLRASWVGSRKYFLGSERLRYLGEQLAKEPPNRGQRTAKRAAKSFASNNGNP